jgi:hypothetical protein
VRMSLVGPCLEEKAKETLPMGKQMKLAGSNFPGRWPHRRMVEKPIVWVVSSSVKAFVRTC